VKWRILTWKGRSRNAPEIPPMEVKIETTNATNGGIKTDVSTPETENEISKKFKSYALLSIR